MVIWYALALVWAPFLAMREKSRFRRALLWTALAATAIGAGEFCVASLAEAAETARHLWLFHVFTDVTIFLALVYAASRFGPNTGQICSPACPIRGEKPVLAADARR
jgi:hypothetical protein